jgi:lipopolysaccharide export LptBFGC system permease protein LptF
MELNDSFDLIDILATTVDSQDFEDQESSETDTEIDQNESTREIIEEFKNPKHLAFITNKFNQNIHELANYVRINNEEEEEEEEEEILDKNAKEQLMNLHKTLELSLSLRTKALIVQKHLDIPELKNTELIIKDTEQLIESLILELQKLKSDIYYLKMEKIDIEI